MELEDFHLVIRDMRDSDNIIWYFSDNKTLISILKSKKNPKKIRTIECEEKYPNFSPLTEQEEMVVFKNWYRNPEVSKLGDLLENIENVSPKEMLCINEDYECYKQLEKIFKRLIKSQKEITRDMETDRILGMYHG
jgi:hypothetical protein